MRDIRKRSHNLRSKKAKDEDSFQGLENKSKSRNHFREEQDDISRRAELYEKKEYPDIDYTRDGKPILKASTHFDLANGPESRRKRRDDFDVLKRSEFFNSHRKNPDEKVVREYERAKHKKKKIGRRVTYSLVILALLTLGALTFIFDKATILIAPKYKDVDVAGEFLIFKDDFEMDTATTTASKSILKSEPKEVNEKASGEITIYNNYSSEPQVLIKNTRFQDKDGKVFRIRDSVTVPGKTGETPGSFQAKVLADSYGADYNIGPSDFTIPGLKGNVRYNYFYAKSAKAMTGGISGMRQVVAESDMAEARKVLEPKVTEALAEISKAVMHPGYYTLSKSPLVTIIDNASELASTDKNTFEVTGQATIFSIKSETLAKMLAEQALGENYNSQEGIRLEDISNLQIEMATDTTPESNLLKLKILGKARLVWTYNEEALKSSLAGQKTAILGEVIDKYNYAILNARSIVKPVWSRSFPKAIHKISIVEELK